MATLALPKILDRKRPPGYILEKTNSCNGWNERHSNKDYKDNVLVVLEPQEAQHVLCIDSTNFSSLPTAPSSSCCDVLFQLRPRLCLCRSSRASVSISTVHLPFHLPCYSHLLSPLTIHLHKSDSWSRDKNRTPNVSPTDASQPVLVHFFFFLVFSLFQPVRLTELSQMRQ